MVEAERLAEDFLSITVAEQALRCFAALKEARLANDQTALKVLEKQAKYYAEFIAEGKPEKKKK